MDRIPGDDPSHVRPETAVSRRVRVTFLVGILVVKPVRGDPPDGPTLQSERGANREEILNQLWSLIAAVSEQAVIADPYTKAFRYPPEHKADGHRLPTEHEEGRNGAHVKKKQEQRDVPIEGLRECFVSVQGSSFACLVCRCLSLIELRERGSVCNSRVIVRIGRQALRR